MRSGLAVALTISVLFAGCGREGVEPPALRIMRYAASWPCPAGDSGRHDLTLNAVEVSGEPTMYDVVITCAPGDSSNAVVVERGRWTVIDDTAGSGGASLLELLAEDGSLFARYRRGGMDSLVPLNPDGTPQDIVLLRRMGEP